MAATETRSYPEYPVFKGLQKPLEFMGLQGRYIFWAAGSGGAGLIVFIIVYFMTGFLYGMLSFAATLGAGIILIFIRQKKGLHTKKEMKGVFIFAHSTKK